MTVIDPRGIPTVTEYDDLGRLSKVTDGVGNVVQPTYDPNGNKVLETHVDRKPDGTTETFTTRFAYDLQNRLIAVVDDNDSSRILTVSYHYDERGNLTSEVDAEGNTRKFEYDIRGNRSREIDAEGNPTEFTYDDADRLATVKDANGTPTTLQYDDHDNLIEEKRADGATWTFTYDDDNNRKTATDPNGTVVMFDYDDADRVVSRSISRGQNVLGPSSVTYTPDDLGRMVATATDEGVKTLATYDSLDRQLTESRQIAAGPVLTVTKSYDAAGNMTGLRYPSGLSLFRAFDPLNRIATIAETGAARPIATYSDAGGRMIGRSLTNGVGSAWTYDAHMRLAAITDQIAGVNGRSVTYQRTPNGNKANIVRADLRKQWSYSYNRNSWITSETVSRTDTDKNPMLMSTTYDIDPVLNYRTITRATQSDQTNTAAATNAIVNSRNQYTSFGNQTLNYDANGNLRHSGNVTMQYDSENHLRKAVMADGTTVENLYDANGRKVEEKTTTGGTTHSTHYVFIGERVVEEYDDGSMARRYVGGRSIDEKVRAEIGSVVVYPMQDELANVERLTDGSGATLERYQYDGYGQFHIFDAFGGERSTSAYAWRALFQGSEFQPILNAYDFRARTLWPELGRFGQEDPAGSVDSQNRNQALLLSFVNHADPLGLYQADFHFGLTNYLALQVGFAPPHARTIAMGAEAPDQNPETSPIATTIHAAVNTVMGTIMRGPRGAAKREKAREQSASMRADHFPRGDNDERLVQPFSQEALQRLKDAMQTGNLFAFGEGLHTMQDSMSHRGHPSLGISGHAWENGGPASTSTDVPYKYPKQALTAAEATFNYLAAFRSKRAGGGARSHVLWGGVMTEANRFILLQEREDKRVWLVAHGVDMPSSYWDDVDMGPIEFDLKYGVHDQTSTPRPLMDPATAAAVAKAEQQCHCGPQS
jgi:RHS repeat-associated protein